MLLVKRGIEMDKAIDFIWSFRYSSNVRDLAYVTHFIKDFSNIFAALCFFLQKYVPFDFIDECKVAFDTLKKYLTFAPIIEPPNWELPFQLMCDATDKAVLAVLSQRVGIEPDFIYYASMTLDSSQSNYSTTKKY